MASARREHAHLQRTQVEQAARAGVVQARTLMLTANAHVSATRRGVVAAEQSLPLSEDRFRHCIGQCPQDALAFETPNGWRVEPDQIRRFKLNTLGRRAKHGTAQA